MNREEMNKICKKEHKHMYNINKSSIYVFDIPEER